MVYYIFVCRSLTFAQKTASVLERAGITAYIMRSPKNISQAGCSYSVKISEAKLVDALSVLKRVYLSPERVYVVMSDGSHKEVYL